MYEVYRDPEGVMLREHPEIEPYFKDINPETARQAHMGTSMSPEVRGARLRSDYALNLINAKANLKKRIETAQARGADIPEDWESQLETWFNEFREGLKAVYTTYCHARGRCISAMITGPANFPVSRAQKANNSADSAWEKVVEFGEKSEKRFLKQLMTYGDGSVIKSNDPNASEKLQNKVDELERAREAMKAANVIIRKIFKGGEGDEEKEKMCVAALKDGPLSKYSEENILQIVQKDCFGGRGFASYTLQNTGAEIRRLKGRIKEVEATEQVDINDEFDNGVSVCISDDNKIVIDFGFKPDEETRKILKRNAFKWSRGRVAWVRMVTGNALFSYRREIKPMLAALEA